jgi:hypothetical protein
MGDKESLHIRNFRMIETSILYVASIQLFWESGYGGMVRKEMPCGGWW